MRANLAPPPRPDERFAHGFAPRGEHFLPDRLRQLGILRHISDEAGKRLT